MPGDDAPTPEGEVRMLRRDVTLLQERVQRLETLLHAPASRLPVKSPAAGDEGEAEAPPSFTPPARPSLEARIGSQVFNRAGIVAVLIGVAWFLKYAVDQHWLGAPMRVAVGLAGGAGLIAWSERFRRRGFPVFSFSLKAVGTGILYLSLWAASALFGLVPYGAALVGMALITGGNAWLCMAQRSQVLAAYALAGGFLTPALLGLGHSSPITLGAYLALLNAGLFAMMRLRQWPRLLPAAFAGTVTYMLWLAFRAASWQSSTPVLPSLAVVAFFFVVFSLASIYLIEPDAEAQRLASVTVVANAFAGGVALWVLIAALPPRPSPMRHWTGIAEACWFAALLAAGRLRNPRLQRLAAVHAALVMALAALGMWLALGRAGFILGLTAEAAVLLTLSLRLRQGPAAAILASPAAPVLVLGSAAALLIAESLLHLLPPATHVFANARFALFCAAAAASVLGVRVAARMHALRQGHATAWTGAGSFFSLCMTFLLLLAGVFEARTAWNGGRSVPEHITVSAWAATLGVALLIAGFRVRWGLLRWQGLALLTLAVAKVFLVDTRSLTQGYGIVSFLGLGVLLLAVSFIYQRDLLNLRGKEHGGDA